MNKLIFFELNEVPVRIMQFYARLKPQSAVAAVMNSARKFESYTENKGDLTPWNNWPTLHRGITNEKHHIQDLGQEMHEVDREYPSLWNILAREGRKVGVFGSLHSYPLPHDLSNYAFYVPDVFASGPESHPKAVEVFQEFNLNLARKSMRNASKKTPLLDGLKLAANVKKLGFTFDTITGTLSQIVQEKQSPWKTVRRRTFQSVLAFDVFMHQLEKNKPDFVTYFTNHVASSMHRFWAAAFPEEYDNLPFDSEWLSTYNKEIIFAMDATDRMLSRLVNFIDRNGDYKLVIASSMGQEAIAPKAVESSLFVKDAKKFLQQLGLSSSDYACRPAMFPQFNLELRSGFDTFEASLAQLKIAGTALDYRKNGNVYSLDFGQQLTEGSSIELFGTAYRPEDLGLENVLIEDKCGSTAYHIPEGVFFVYHPSFAKNATHNGYTKISTTEVAPMVMKNFGIQPKPYMNNVSNKTVEAVF